ncbi:MAG TPA: hypothetical protein VFS49_01750 [Croceibacterium sp.]|nr:hypothetical protein [Croceibacterium sp.]
MIARAGAGRVRSLARQRASLARHQADWFGLGFDAWLLGIEVARVVWLRSWLIALGGAGAEREARLMVEEKLAAHAAFGWTLATGAAGRSPQAVGRRALRHYGSRVRANARRLAR